MVSRAHLSLHLRGTPLNRLYNLYYSSKMVKPTSCSQVLKGRFGSVKNFKTLINKKLQSWPYNRYVFLPIDQVKGIIMNDMKVPTLCGKIDKKMLVHQYKVEKVKNPVPKTNIAKYVSIVEKNRKIKEELPDPENPNYVSRTSPVVLAAQLGRLVIEDSDSEIMSDDFNLSEKYNNHLTYFDKPASTEFEGSINNLDGNMMANIEAPRQAMDDLNETLQIGLNLPEENILKESNKQRSSQSIESQSLIFNQKIKRGSQLSNNNYSEYRVETEKRLFCSQETENSLKAMSVDEDDVFENENHARDLIANKENIPPNIFSEFLKGKNNKGGKKDKDVQKTTPVKENKSTDSNEVMDATPAIKQEVLSSPESLLRISSSHNNSHLLVSLTGSPNGGPSSREYNSDEEDEMSLNVDKLNLSLPYSSSYNLEEDAADYDYDTEVDSDRSWLIASAKKTSQEDPESFQFLEEFNKSRLMTDWNINFSSD